MSKILKIEDAFKHEIEVIDSNFPDEPEVLANFKRSIKEYGESVRKSSLEEAMKIANAHNFINAPQLKGQTLMDLERSDILKIE
jgi:hypothetical protein